MLEVPGTAFGTGTKSMSSHPDRLQGFPGRTGRSGCFREPRASGADARRSFSQSRRAGGWRLLPVPDTRLPYAKGPAPHASGQRCGRPGCRSFGPNTEARRVSCWGGHSAAARGVPAPRGRALPFSCFRSSAFLRCAPSACLSVFQAARSMEACFLGLLSATSVTVQQWLRKEPWLEDFVDGRGANADFELPA